MADLNLEALGFTKDEVLAKVVEAVARSVMESTVLDEDGEEGTMPSTFARSLKEKVQERIDSAVSAVVEKHILPNAEQHIERVTLQKTTQWGEKVGQPVTFLEYLTSRAESYLTEPVSFEGKSKSESKGYSWSGTQSRITHMVHQHLHYSVEAAMKNALSVATSALSQGINDTVKMKLDEVVKQIQVSVKTR
ncbi:MAG: hypothetical protein WC876_01975 [Candidatus Thermoplasmatota archaeon]|jgi:hypothetical protein